MQNVLFLFTTIVVVAAWILGLKLKNFSVSLMVISSSFWSIAAFPENDSMIYGALVACGLIMMMILMSDLKRLRIDFLSLIFVTFILIILFSAISSETTLKGVIRFGLLLIFYLFINSFEPQQKFLLLLGILWGFHIILLSQLFCLVLKISENTDISSGEVRFGGLLGHPNYAAYLAGLCLLLVLKFRKSLGDLSYLFAAIDLVVVSSTGARSAFAGTVLGILWLITFSVFSINNKERILTKSNLMISAIGLMIIFRFQGVILDRFEQVFKSGGLRGSNSLGWRFLQWETALRELEKNPVFGNGWHSAGDRLLQGLSAHNMYLQSWLEFGWIGLLICSLIFFTVIIRLARNGLTLLVPLLVISSIMDAGILFPSIAFCSIAVYGLKPIEDVRRQNVE